MTKKKNAIATNFIIAAIISLIIRVTQRAEIKHIFIIVDGFAENRYKLLYCISFAVLLFIVFFLLCGIYELFFKSATSSSAIFWKNFYVYFVIQIIVLILVWPGMYKADEIYLLYSAVANLQVYWIQSFFTQMLYDIALMIFPYLFSVVLLQLFVISLFEAFIVVEIHEITDKKWAIRLIQISFFLFPILDSNQYALRNSIIAWIFTWMVISIYVDIQKENKYEWRQIIKYIVTCALMETWKVEYICIVPFVILLLILSGRDKNILKKSLITVCVFLFAHTMFSLPNIISQEDNNYELTAYMTPVAEIVINHVNDHDAEYDKDFETIEKYFDVSRFDEPYLGLNTPSEFGEIDNLDKNQKIELRKVSINLCMAYFDEYLRNRLYVCRYANGLVNNTYNHAKSVHLEYDGKDFYSSYFKYTYIGNGSLRSFIIPILACRNPGDYIHTNMLYPFFYNSLWGMFGVLIVFLISVFRKEFMNSILYMGIIVCFIAVFMFEPAAFFMYYMPYYIAGNTISIIKIIELVSKNDKRVPE